MTVPSRENALLWFGLLGAPVAWTAQHWATFSLSVLRCSAVGDAALPLRGLNVVASIVAAAVAVAALAASIAVFRATADNPDEDTRRARMHFLATIGMTVSPLMLAIIVLNGLGGGVLEVCRQS
jgi:hypothetical protein